MFGSAARPPFRPPALSTWHFHTFHPPQEIGEVLEKEGNKEEAIMFFEQAADLYHTENSTAEASKCNLKVSRAGAARERAWAVAWCQAPGAAQAASGIWGPVAAALDRSGRGALRHPAGPALLCIAALLCRLCR